MMKAKMILTTITLFIMTIANAQQNPQHIAGKYNDAYGGCDLIIFEDNTFVMIAYATVINGTLDIKGDNITFTAVEPAPFNLYGRKNSHIAGGKIMYDNFDQGVSLMNYTDKSQAMESMRLVFNLSANCFSYPYVHHFETDIETLAFACIDKRFPYEMLIKKPLPDEQYQFTPLEVYQFENVNTYNDFAVAFHEQRHLQPFHAKIVDNGNAIVMSNLNINSGNQANRKIEKEEIEDEILEYKEWRNTEPFSMEPKEYVFLNPAYREFTLDTNTYIHIGNDIYVCKDVLNPNGTYDQGDTEDYHNSNVIYKYNRVAPKIDRGGVYRVEKEPFFTVKCE